MTTARLLRLLKLVQLLHSRRARTAAELAEELGVSRRTVFRELELLGKAGIGFVFDRETKRYSAGGATLLPPVAFSHAEALTLLLLTREGLKLPFVDDADLAATAAMKIESMLPATLHDECSPWTEVVEIRAPAASDAGGVSDVLMALRQAAVQLRVVVLMYDSLYDGGIIEVAVHPYRLVFFERGWYVIAYSEMHQTFRTFKLERIKDARMLVTEFNRDPTFSLDDYFGHAWRMMKDKPRFHVKIRFSPRVAVNVYEVRWHKTQRTQFSSDGSLLFEADVDGVQEMQWWVLGYGAEAEVLEPQELRDLVAQHAATLCSTYGTEAATSTGRLDTGEGKAAPPPASAASRPAGGAP